MFRFLIFLVATAALAHGVPSDTLVSSRIIGGVDAKEGQYPYQVSLKLGGVKHNCGGCFITNRTILTAAHCVSGWRPTEYFVFAGSYKLQIENGDKKLLGIEKFVIHKDYNSPWERNDIGLVILKEAVEFNELISSIEPGETYIEGGSNVTFTGWGSTKYPITTDSLPNTLQAIDLKTISFEQCTSQIGIGAVAPTEICTNAKVGEGSCSTDSGSPLVAGGKVVGISVVPKGTPCAVGKPDIFTRVSSYINWIDSHKV